MVDEENLTPEEREAITYVNWVNENPDKVVWVDGTDILEKYAQIENPQL